MEISFRYICYKLLKYHLMQRRWKWVLILLNVSFSFLSMKDWVKIMVNAQKKMSFLHWQLDRLSFFFYLTNFLVFSFNLVYYLSFLWQYFLFAYLHLIVIPLIFLSVILFVFLFLVTLVHFVFEIFRDLITELFLFYHKVYIYI